MGLLGGETQRVDQAKWVELPNWGDLFKGLGEQPRKQVKQAIDRPANEPKSQPTDRQTNQTNQTNHKQAVRAHLRSVRKTTSEMMSSK